MFDRISLPAFAISCDNKSEISKVLFINPNSGFNPAPKNKLIKLVDPGSSDKVKSFLADAEKKGFTQGWEVVINNPAGYFPILLFGYFAANEFLVIGASGSSTANATRQLLIEEQASVLGKWMDVLKSPISPQPNEFFEQNALDAISMFNNEIVMLQRELYKKQTELEKLNSELLAYSNTLEEMVEQRTQALKKSESKFRSIFESSPLGIALLEEDGKVTIANRSLYDILGIDFPKSLHLEIKSLLNDDQGEKRNGFLINSPILTPDPNRWIEKKITRKDGNSRWVNINISVISLKDSQNKMVVVLIEDVTEKKAVQQTLLHAEKINAVGRIASSLAHEINNPLQGVLGNIGLAQESLADGKDSLKFLKIASSELKRVSKIVMDLKQVSQKPIIKEKKVTTLNETLLKAIALVKKKCEESNITLEIHLSREKTCVWINSDQISQVILNLLLNAIDAMPNGGNLSIFQRKTEQPSGISTFVENDGIPIERDLRDQIFEPFFSTKQGGIGLGLYLSKEIMNGHSGTLQYVETSPRNTVFEMWLPIKDCNEENCNDSDINR